ncbi:DUF6502 family protein [soil metagenome]
MQRLLTELLLDEGTHLWREQAVEPNISQLSVTTGLNRKAITLRVRTPAADAPHNELSAAAKTLTLWAQLREDDPALQSLPLSADDGSLTFEVIARRASRGNLHHRAILEELIRLDLVAVQEGRATLKSSSFVPLADLHSMLVVLGDNAHDHLAAAVSNVLHDNPPMLERAIYARGLTLEDCEAIQQLVRTRWSVLHRELASKMTSAVDADSDDKSARIRVGIYAYTEQGREDRLAKATRRASRQLGTSRDE